MKREGRNNPFLIPLFFAFIAFGVAVAHDPGGIIDRTLVAERTCDIAELVEAGRDLNPHLELSEGVFFVNSVYITPAQQLRNQADSIEIKDSAILRFRAALDDCSWVLEE